MLVMGIESTCDETGCAIVREGREILSNIVSTQIDLHKEFGGVVPELACRRHVEVIIPIVQEALDKAKCSLNDIDLFAVANGPGLIGALLIGVNVAKAFSFSLHRPLVGVNHVEAHLYAAIMSYPSPLSFPCLGVVLSGGHTALLLMKGIGDYKLIGQTIDDAIGEAFDKTAKILGLPYPGGPEIEALAKQGGDRTLFHFKAGKVKGSPYDFSFSGLKTAVLYAAKGQSAGIHSPLIISDDIKKHIAAAFQHTAFENIVEKISLASKEYQCDRVVLGGGVCNNRYLRQLCAAQCPELEFIWPAVELTLDNAAMIAGLGYHRYLRYGPASLSLEAIATMRL